MSPAVKGAAALTRGQCITCHGRKRLLVRVNPGRRVEADCPTCGGSGEISRCAACGHGEPDLHVCEMACNFVDGDAVCGAATLGSVVTRDRWWARCEEHGGLDAADDVRRAELQAARASTWRTQEAAAGPYCPHREVGDRMCDECAKKMSAELEARAKVCADCGSRTDASPCPLCGKIVCQLCAEREGEFCCPGSAAPPPPSDFAPTAPQMGPIVVAAQDAPASSSQLIIPDPPAPAPPITSNKRRRKKPPTSAPAIARRRRGPSAPGLPGIPDHHDAPWCGCDRCWGDA